VTLAGHSTLRPEQTEKNISPKEIIASQLISTLVMTGMQIE